MVLVMLRSLSLVFCHAVFSGIVGYFITTALIRKEKMGALIVIGFGNCFNLTWCIHDYLPDCKPPWQLCLQDFHLPCLWVFDETQKPQTGSLRFKFFFFLFY